MTSTKRLLVYAVVILLLPLALLALPRLRRQPVPPSAEVAPAAVPSARQPLSGSRHPWTLAEARAALQREPDDAYLQFVVLQLAAQQYRLAEVRADLPLFATGRPRTPFGLALSPDAVQPQLQAATILAEPAAAPPTGTPPVALDPLHGPELPGRSWPAPLAGRQPAGSALALAVPDDFYLAEFRTLERLNAVHDAGRTWLGFLRVQAARDATSRPVWARLQQQLAVQLDDRALLPLVAQVGLAGSDPFWLEGSDVTLLVQLRPDAVEAFRSRAERSLQEAAAQPGAGRSSGKHQGVTYDYVATADRRLSAYAVTLTDRRLHLRSNSRAALHRVLDAIAGAPTRTLAGSAEYQYVRTLLPAGATEEDGLLFVPEALRRRLVEPTVQLVEARRRIGYNHLRLIGHAAQLYRTQLGKAPRSLDELTQTGYAPGPFNQRRLASPFGGTYTLSADGTRGVCSVLGTADHLTPLLDLPVTGATVEEAVGYREFVKHFDAARTFGLWPTAVRVQAGPRQLRAEAVLLSPADGPIHRVLSPLVGGASEPLDPLPVSRRSLASISVRLDKERWLHGQAAGLSAERFTAVAQLGASLGAAPWPALLAAPVPEASLPGVAALGVEPAMVRTLLQRGLGNQAALHWCAAPATLDFSLPAAALLALPSRDRQGAEATKPLPDGRGSEIAAGLAALLTTPVYLAIPVKDSAVVDRFLAQLDAGLARQAPTWHQRRLGIPLQGEFYHLTTKAGLALRALGVRAGPARYRLFWARLGDGLYVANQPAILDDLQAAAASSTRSLSSDRGPTAHALLKLRLGQGAQALPGQRLGWEEANREACLANLNRLSAAARAFSFTPPVSSIAFDAETRERLVMKYASQLHGCEFACPDGGHYTLAEDGKSFVCSVHGSPARPRQPDQPAASNPAEQIAEATLAVTRLGEGWRVVVTVTPR